MPADLDEKALADLKGVCDDVEAVLIHGSPPLDGFEWRLGRARAAILAYEAARAKALPSDVQSVVERLRATTEEMANHASVAMDLWDRHSHAALEAATLLETLARGQEWQPIEKAPKDGTKVLIWNEEGHEIAWWEDACPDSPDQPGHDAGWFGSYAFPGRSAQDRYHCEPQGQPTHFKPLTPPPAAQGEE